MIKIAACFITKGDAELEKLKASVASVSPYVHSVHIVCNAEHEKTFIWGKSCGFDMAYLPWNKNFSEQRNYSFARVPKDTQYVYWQDSDDVLLHGEYLQEIAKRAYEMDLDCVYMDYFYSCVFKNNVFTGEDSIEQVEIKQARERLLNPKSIEWKGRLHETPVEKPGYAYKHAPIDPKEFPIAVVHTSAHRYEDQKIQAMRDQRNREILELQLEEERSSGKADPRTILYLMKILAESQDEKDFERCFNLGEEYLSLSGWDQERSICLVLQGRCAQYLGNIPVAKSCYEDAIKEYRYSTIPYIRLAEVLCIQKKYAEADFIMTQVLQMQESNLVINNVLEEQYLTLQVMLKLYWEWDHKRSVRKAAKLSQQLAALIPYELNVQYAEKMSEMANLDIACEHLDKYCQYLMSIDQEKAVFDTLQNVPQAMKSLPFVINYLKKVAPPKIWGEKEICYIANFGGKAIEHWDGESLKKGIGGSETAVIELSKEWTKLGYSVTVYGDPVEEKIIDGVRYLPWYYLNFKDSFSTVIQWRSANLSKKLSCKKFFVDLHDVVSPASFEGRLSGITALLVKSEAHKKLLYGIPDEKIVVIQNGIRL